MADRLDVEGRLAEGRSAVEHTEAYVRACHAFGYQHPGLTAHPAQIRDWYEGEEGLDLRALDRDCAELRAAGAAVMEALAMQRAQLAQLAAAWLGQGGDSAVRFLERHCDAASSVATEVRAAAQRCESLRDNLWYLVDSKVTTAVAIDEGTRAQRASWLAAVAAVTTGAGDRAAAEEVVRREVTPYVDNEIRDDWLSAMRSTADGVDTSYAMVIDRMAAVPAARFEVPGDFGPGDRPRPASPTAAGPVVAPAPPPAPPADPVAAPALSTAAPPLPDLGAASAMPAGDVGGGPGGLGALADRIVGAMGSLLGTAGDRASIDDALDGDFGDDFDDEDPFHPDDAGDKADQPEEAKDVAEERDSAVAEPAQQAPPVDEAAPAPVDAPPAPVAAPVAEPGPVAAPPAPGSTPCEIAADQLPQAGQ
ncbi:hypothetical protein [Mycobacterium sp. 1081908.1]|uniref:hypothetical protein n=1 Tax=Mycobacterium sp. 1081908.1 TaxID=1834066 RepID=UPI0008017911|nr:hypothetical protein [Mycobacterium sp. 1081908.1]OBK52847.1 hypothetical protein A5655_21035 [Mycobacterium sp. 1081908.1]